jgi:AraC-like DNA-binding protein
MRKSKYIILLPVMLAVLVLMSGCSGNGAPGQVSGADSIYAWENIRQYCMQDPERSFAMVDSAQEAGIADANYANWMRAQIYMNAPEKDMEKARECCMAILDNTDPAPDSLQCVKTYHLLVSIGMNMGEYEEAIDYASKGAKIAHENGWNGEEAEFYFKAGDIMEHVQKGSGTEYLDRSLNIFRGTTKPQALPLFASHLGSVARFAVNGGDYARALALTNERLEVTERIAREIPTAPAGYIDDQKAYIYSILAYCQWQLGDKAAARRSAEAFEQTQASRTPEHMSDILAYYSIAGEGGRIRQIYDMLEPYYRQREDTISINYASLVQTYAYGLDKLGRGHEAFEAMDRYRMLSDSLVQRERRAETLKLAQQMKTQEKEMQLKDEETKTTIYRIISVSAILIILLIVYLLWRSYKYNQELARKNRRLLAEIEERERHEQQAIEQLEAVPEAELTAQQQLYRRLCELMKEPDLFTDPDLDRGRLAQLLGTNEHYVSDAISACADGKSVSGFLNEYRVRHAARLLATTTDSVALIAELSGFSRSSFFRIFSEVYGMSPSDYRKVARK